MYALIFLFSFLSSAPNHPGWLPYDSGKNDNVLYSTYAECQDALYQMLLTPYILIKNPKCVKQD